MPSRFSMRYLCKSEPRRSGVVSARRRRWPRRSVTICNRDAPNGCATPPKPHGDALGRYAASACRAGTANDHRTSPGASSGGPRSWDSRHREAADRAPGAEALKRLAGGPAPRPGVVAEGHGVLGGVRFRACPTSEVVSRPRFRPRHTGCSPSTLTPRPFFGPRWSLTMVPGKPTIVARRLRRRGSALAVLVTVAIAV